MRRTMSLKREAGPGGGPATIPGYGLAGAKRQSHPRSGGLLRGMVARGGLLPPLLLLALLAGAYYLLFGRLGAPAAQVAVHHHSFSPGPGRVRSSSQRCARRRPEGLDQQPQALRAAAAMAPPNHARYIQALVCKGFCNQLIALADSAALASLLGAKLVLPSFYTDYDYKKLKRVNAHKAKVDSQAAEGVPASEFLDVARLAKALQPHVEVVAELPMWLQGDVGFARIQPHEVDPRKADTLHDYEEWFVEHSVLRLGCMLHMVHWTTQDLRNLRTAFLGAIAPSESLARRVDAQVSQGFQRSKYTFVHLRTEADWKSYCKKEASNTEVSQIASFAECYKGSGQVASYLEILELAGDPGTERLYIAGGEVSAADVELFKQRGFKKATRGMSPAAKAGAEGKPGRDVMAAVEWFVALDAAVVVGNVFSSFDWMLREARALRGAPTYFYNRAPHESEGQILASDSMRWNVNPFPNWPPVPLQARSRDRRSLDDQPAGTLCELPQPCSCEDLQKITILESKPETNGIISLKVGATGVCHLCIFRLKIYADGNLVADELGNNIVRLNPNKTLSAEEAAKGPYRLFLDVAVALEVDTYREVEIKVCCGEDASGPETGRCSEPLLIMHRPSLHRGDISTRRGGKPPPGRIFFQLQHKWQTGGPEALHQLHNVINQLAVTGYINTHSVFANGNSAYQTEFSNFTGLLVPWDLRPHDIIVMPEAVIGDTTLGMADVSNHVGTLPIVWYLGQLTSSVTEFKWDKPGFRPLCLTDYFAKNEGCPPKAVINTPMGTKFMDEAERWQQRADHLDDKEDIILYDPELSDDFDINAIQVPPGAKLIKFQGFKKEEVMPLYRRAKVIIDPMITGCERALFEAVLFDVIPIVAYHGPARDYKSFPIPRDWTWQLWDYDNLNRLIASAIGDHPEAVKAFEPLYNHTKNLPQEFVKQTFDYFADDVLFIFSGLCNSLHHPGCSVSSVEDRSAAILAGAAALSGHPFADVEVIVENDHYMHFEFAGFFEGLEVLGHDRAFKTTEILPEFRRFLSSSVFFQPPRTNHRREFAVLMPPGAISLSPGLLAIMIRTAREQGVVALRHTTSGLLLVDWWTYFRDIQRTLPLMPDAVSTATIMAVLRDHLELSVADFDEFPHSVVHIGDDPQCLLPLQCRSLLEIVRGPLWMSTISRISYDDAPIKWFKEAERHCLITER